MNNDGQTAVTETESAATLFANAVSVARLRSAALSGQSIGSGPAAALLICRDGMSGCTTGGSHPEEPAERID